jgi:hypothetical protein
MVGHRHAIARRPRNRANPSALLGCPALLGRQPAVAGRVSKGRSLLSGATPFFLTTLARLSFRPTRVRPQSSRLHRCAGR